MVRGLKTADWSLYLKPEDLAFVSQRIDLKGWYPMETFERMGVGILKEVALGQLEAVRMWGRLQVGVVTKAYPTMVAENDPRETMMRFRVLADSFFDYGALRVEHVEEDHATVVVKYGMSAIAEEAASYQTLGFFEALIERAGGSSAEGRFDGKSWAGDPRTLIVLHWHAEPPSVRERIA